MPSITFIDNDGEATEVLAEVGETAMEAARRCDVAGVVAECGGNCSCGTCHVYVDPAWTASVGPPEPAEEDLLEGTFDPEPNSRLSCQIVIAPEHDGLILRVPERQM